MSIFYHILGVFAGINERLSRQTVNFIQINWILIGFSFFGFTFALGNYFNSVDINKSPEPISIEDIEKSYNNNIKYVTVKGLYDPYFAIEYGNRSKGSTELNVTDVYIPIVEFKNDAKSNLIYGVYIKQDKDFKVNDPKEVVEITGMIENLNYHVKDQLDKIEDNKGINTSFSINPKGSPPNSNLAILILIGSIIPAIGFGYTWIKRYKIIQSNSEKILPSSVQIDQFSSFAEESKKRNK